MLFLSHYFQTLSYRREDSVRSKTLTYFYPYLGSDEVRRPRFYTEDPFTIETILDRNKLRCQAAFYISLLLYSPLRRLIISILPALFVRADIVNITVDDTSPDILYLPASSWHQSGIPCSSCLDPGPSIAFNGTWHDGTHIIPTADADDQPTSTSFTLSPTTSAEDGGHDDGNGFESKHGKNRRMVQGISRREKQVFHRQSCSNDPFCVPKFDGDDTQFVDNPVIAQFNFTGT